MQRIAQIVIVSVSVLICAPALAQNLTFNGQLFVPDWGTGTTLRANDDTPVYEVQRGSGGAVTARHISPSRLSRCYGGANNIIWLFSQALHQPSVSLAPAPRDPGPCFDISTRSLGGFQEAYEPESNGARHIGVTAWTNSNRTRMQGVIRYESDTNLKGVCGGAVIGLVDSSNRLIHYYTPPTGCGNGKFGGHANQRFVVWEDDIPIDVRERIAGVRVKIIFTEGRDHGGNVWEFITSVADKIKNLAEAAAALAVTPLRR